MRDGLPHVGGEVVVAVGETLEDGRRVDVLERHVVALPLERDLPQLGGGDALLPAVEDGDRELALRLLAAGTRACDVLGRGDAAGQAEGADGQEASQRHKTLGHAVIPFSSRRISPAGCIG
ncbi:hypothetical protein GCM10009746_29920 [Microbacterium paludicola]